MNLVYHRKRVNRSIFRKVPFGTPYWLASNTAVAPSLKYNRRNNLTGWDNANTGTATLTAVADTSVAVIRVPEAFLSQNSANQ